MERVLLGVSLAVSLVVFLLRFIPLARGGARPQVPPREPLHAGLRLVALLAPWLGLLVTLPTHGAVFAEGQRLGLGFLLGGLAALLAHLNLWLPARNPEPDARPALSVVANYGTGIAAVSLALLFLRASLLDGLMGVAIGNLAVTIALLVALPEAARVGAVGRRLVTGAGFTIALATAVGLAAFRDALTPDLAKLTWSTLLVAFASLGTLIVAGTSLFPLEKAGRYGRLIPLAALLALGGVGLHQLTVKLTDTHTLTILGIGALLVWPVALAILRETTRRGGPDVNGLLAVPLLSVLVITSGFLACLQTLQGTGVAVGVLALFLAYPATFALVPSLGDDSLDEAEAGVPVTAVGLLLFATVLLLWRFFVTRWTGELRGVNLSDQYALFGLIVGAALPGLLSLLPGSVRSRAGASGVVALGVTATLTLSAPAAVLVLFGAKSAVALLLGLALGAMPLRTVSRGASLLPGLCAVAVALALDQWTGHVLPDEVLTRAEKLRYLIGIMATVIILVITAAQMQRAKASGEPAGDKA